MLATIGPIVIGHGDPQFSWASTPDDGIRPGTISGSCSWAQAKQLSELVANRGRRTSVGGRSGVLEYIVFDDDLLDDFTGWYLLESFALSPAHKHSLTTTDVPFTLSAAHLPRHLAAVVTRSAHARPNDLSLAATAIVSDPFGRDSATSDPFAHSPGGNLARRPFDANEYSIEAVPSVRSLGFRAGLVSASGSELQPIVVPVLQSPESYGADCRAYDRRDERNVRGQGHPFAAPTDLLITNGLLRCRPGPAGVPAYLHVSAVTASAWVDVGCLQLSESNALLSARLTAVAPDEVAITMLVQGEGEVLVTLHRAERMLRIRHGGDRQPIVSVPRVVGWLGMPPTRQLSGAANGTGRYGRGLTTTGIVEWPWPGQRGSWAMSGNWLPAGASTAQADSGLMTMVAANGDTSRLRWDAATDTVKWVHGGSTLTTPLLAFAANAPVAWSLSYDGTTARMSVRVGATTHVASVAVGPGTTEANWTSMLVGAATGGFGLAAFGSGVFGGGSPTAVLGGVLDNLMVFDGPLTDAEVTTLLSSPTALGGLPTPEGRLIWYAPFDADVVPLGSAMAGGRRYQATTEGGATRDADDDGLTKGLGVLRSVVTPRSPFAVILPGTVLEVGAFLATAEDQDDIEDHHRQLGAASEEKVAMRP